MRGSDRTEKHFLHLVWSLKIEYKTTETRPPRQQICRGEHCSPVLVARQTLRYPHNLLHFTNHVGDGALDVPPPQRFALLFIPQTMTTTQRMVGANSVRPFRSPHSTSWKIQTSQLPQNGLSHFCELANRNFAKPLQIFVQVLPPQNRSARSFIASLEYYSFPNQLTIFC